MKVTLIYKRKSGGLLVDTKVFMKFLQAGRLEEFLGGE